MRIQKKVSAAALAERLSDAYAFEIYGKSQWAACVKTLRAAGHDDLRIEAILRSKWVRWAADEAKPRKATAKGLLEFLNSHRGYDLNVYELVKETFPAASVCEHCGDYRLPANDDKTCGQVCTRCQAENGLPIIRLTTDESETDAEARFFAGLEMAKDWIEEGGAYGEWLEFSHDEYEYNAPVKADWDSMPDLQATSFDALQQSLEARTQFLIGFWGRHRDILEARDEAMNKWSSVQAGEPKPIYWKNVPDFKVILQEVE
jgi:ribosomal protein L32